MHFFRFTNRFLQLTSASAPLMELLLLKQVSRPGCSPLPRAQNLGLENAGASGSSLSSSSSSSCSEALVAEGDLWTGKNAFAAAVLFWVPSRPQRRQMRFFYSEKCIHMTLWIANPLCDDTACWHAALRVLRAEAAKSRTSWIVDRIYGIHCLGKTKRRNGAYKSACLKRKKTDIWWYVMIFLHIFVKHQFQS